MASPTIEDLLDLAEACQEFELCGLGGLVRPWRDGSRERFYDTVMYMFGDDIEMAKALIGQIHALQAQIRAMRDEQEAR
ncbi:hypothetical protein [Phytopseudomonas punonensis]|uniref:Uncharacterized protein n=1 Tax=Phytopseudomonas punonensis TaxID=1220495 RepID=A0A1M7LIG6_9GAMM|nr:hypothetical protein [Pseudomonas punonensis]SHM77877.1 hypothetical protein SAMN05216288_4273 [Pseudomonas punonensis]